MPIVVGLDLSAAREVITSAMTDPQLSIEYRETDFVPPGRVFVQRPPAGVHVSPGSQIQLTISTGGYPNSRDVWQDYNHRQEFEHDLINRKTTWGLTSQTILFAAYGVTLTLSGDNTPGHKYLVAISNDFRKTVIVVGLLIAAVTFVAVLATINSKRLSWRQYKDFYKCHAHLEELLVKRPLQWGVSTPNTVGTMTFEAFLPLIFFGAWLYLLIHNLTAAIVTLVAIAIVTVGVIVGWDARTKRKCQAEPDAAATRVAGE